jgi:hypothetical protein
MPEEAAGNTSLLLRANPLIDSSAGSEGDRVVYSESICCGLEKEHSIAKHAQAAEENGHSQHAAVASFFQYCCGGWSNIHTGPVLLGWEVAVETALAGWNLMNAVRSGGGREGEKSLVEEDV